MFTWFKIFKIYVSSFLNIMHEKLNKKLLHKFSIVKRVNQKDCQKDLKDRSLSFPYFSFLRGRGFLLHEDRKKINRWLGIKVTLVLSTRQCRWWLIQRCLCNWKLIYFGPFNSLIFLAIFRFKFLIKVFLLNEEHGFTLKTKDCEKKRNLKFEVLKIDLVK